MNDCAIGERKNMNLPGVVVDLPVLQEKDTRDLVEFACPHNVDFVAASFVQTAADVKTIRKTLDGAGGQKVKIISKIENQEGLDNFAEIVKETDAVMVARGDLGMEIPPERVFRAQKMMINTCNASGTPATGRAGNVAAPWRRCARLRGRIRVVAAAAPPQLASTDDPRRGHGDSSPRNDPRRGRGALD